MTSSPYVKWAPGADPSSLLITFAAISGPLGKPAFAFGNVSYELSCSKLFFVDPFEATYQLGLPGIGNDFWEIAAHIEALRKQHNVKQTVLMGNSSGGFAALVMGAILGNCTVHALNPPTLLSSPQHTHKRNRVLCRKILAAVPRNHRTFNLGTFLKEVGSPGTELEFAL